MTQRIAFLDVDGTILEHGGAIAPSSVTAVRTARANGHLVYLCTGRSDADIPPQVREIGFDGAISNSGAFATRGDELLVSRPMDRADAERLTAYFEDHRLDYVLQSHEAVFLGDGMAELMAEFFRHRREHNAEKADSLGRGAHESPRAMMHYRPARQADLDRVAKAIFVSRDPTVLDRAQDDLGDRFHVVPGSISMPGGSNGEISRIGTNKGAAILEVLDRLGIGPAEAIGIGDSWNDVEMFDVVGTAIAMGNACPQLQARAGRVTTTVLEDGLWNAFVDVELVAP